MVQSEAQKRAKRNYHAKMMASPEYRRQKSQNANKLDKYNTDETYKKNMLEYQFWRYYYVDAEEKAIKSIRRLF